MSDLPMIFFDLLLGHEGGYSNNAADKGGKTCFGVTQKVYNEARTEESLSEQSVKNITKDEAYDIYNKNYWKPLGKINEFPDSSQYILFDLCVNSGLGKALALKKDVDCAEPEMMLEWRTELYVKIVTNNPTQKVFLKGWLNRLNNIAKHFELDCEFTVND